MASAPAGIDKVTLIEAIHRGGALVTEACADAAIRGIRERFKKQEITAAELLLVMAAAELIESAEL